MVSKYKIIIIGVLFLSFSLYGYTVPYHGMQTIRDEVVNKKVYKKIDFKVNEKEYTINESTLKSDDPLLYILSNLFLNKKNLSDFSKNHNIETKKYYLDLLNNKPVVVYGTKEENKTIPQIWLNKETAIPVKAIFKFNGKMITVLFEEFNNLKYGFSLPSKVKIIDGDSEKVYFIY